MKCKAYFQTFKIAALVWAASMDAKATIKQTDGGYKVEWTSCERKDRPC